MKYSKIIIALIFSVISSGMYSQEKVVVKYDNGNIKLDGYSRNNTLDSIYNEYYENGNLKIEGFYRDCKYETNKIKIYILGCGVGQKIDSLTSGTRHGVWKEYHQNGKIKTVSNYHCGLMQGNFYDYYENGNLELQEFYFEGKLKLSQSYNSNGTLEEVENIEYNFKKTREYKTINRKEFYQNGDLKIESTIVKEENDIEIETFKEYYQNGFLKTEKRSINNYRNGVYREYFENGNAKYEGLFKNDKPKGKHYFYGENGKLLKIETWKNNKLKSTKRF